MQLIFRKNTFVSIIDSPLPLLTFLYSERENALEKQQHDRTAEVPEKWILLESCYLPNSDEAMRGKHKACNYRFNCRQELCHCYFVFVLR